MVIAVLFVKTPSGEERLSLEEFENRIRGGDIAASTLVQFSVLTGDRWVRAGDLALFHHLYEPARIHFKRRFSLGLFPWLTLSLVIIQILIFWGLAGSDTSLHFDRLIRAGAKAPAQIFELGETWRLITANFLHRDVLHLFFNMIFFFNVGATIENAYRKQDYVLILLSSALGTTLISSLMSSQASVGASGIVLGFFGGASVFGYRYSDILPRRYRRYFTGIILPYALFILYIGFATVGTDNWGHVGGLLFGSITAWYLKPSLLRLGPSRSTLLPENFSALVSVMLITVVLASGALVRGVGVSMVSFVDHAAGLSLDYPARWRLGANHLAYSARGNELGVSIGIRVRREQPRRNGAMAAKRRFIEEELRTQELSGEITAVSIIQERALELGSAKGFEVIATLDSRVGHQLTRNLILQKGYIIYYIVLSTPKEWAAEYEVLLEEMFASIHLFEPDSLREARRKVKTFPGMSSAQLELANELAQWGEVDSAKQAYIKSLSGLVKLSSARLGLARLTLDYGGDLALAEKSVVQVWEQESTNVEAAVLLAEVRHRRGAIDDAVGVLQTALLQTPNSILLKTRLKELMGIKSSGTAIIPGIE